MRVQVKSLMAIAQRHQHPVFFRKNRRVRTLGLMLLCLGLWSPAPTQTFDRPSLRTELQSTPNNPRRVDLLNALSTAWRDLNIDSAFALARRAYDLARTINYLPGQGDARLNQAYAFLESGRPRDAKTTLEKARVDFRQSGNASGLGKCALAEAAIQFATTTPITALRTCLRADSIFAAASDTTGRIQTHFLQAEIFAAARADSLAYRILKEARALTQDDIPTAGILFRIAEAQARIGREATAITSYNAARDLFQRTQNYAAETEARNRSAALHLKLADTAAAVADLQRAQKIARKFSLFAALAETERLRSRILRAQNRRDSARILLESALDHLPDSTSPKRRATFHLELAEFWLDWPDYNRALAATDSAGKQLDSLPTGPTEQARQALRYQIFNRIGARERALTALRRASTLQDSLHTAHFAQWKAGQALSLTYDRRLRTQETSHQQAAFETNLRRSAAERELILLIAIGALALLTVAFLLAWLRTRSRARNHQRTLTRLQKEIDQADDEIQVLEQKLRDTREDAYRRSQVRPGADPETVEALVQSRTTDLNATIERLRGLNQELDTFMYRASHDLLGPIARLKGLVLVAQGTEEDLESIRAYIRLIEAVSVYMDRVLRKLIIVHELNHSQSQIEPLNIARLIEELTPRLSELPGISQPFILLHDALETDVKVDSRLLTIVLENLLENACMFRADPDNRRPRIEVWLRRVNRDLEIEIKDEGIGIPDQIREQVFDIFFRGSERSKGNGLGLYLVKLAVELLAGRIALESQEGRFTRVLIRVPEQN